MALIAGNYVRNIPTNTCFMKQKRKFESLFVKNNIFFKTIIFL